MYPPNIYPHESCTTRMLMEGGITRGGGCCVSSGGGGGGGGPSEYISPRVLHHQDAKRQRGEGMEG